MESGRLRSKRRRWIAVAVGATVVAGLAAALAVSRLPARRAYYTDAGTIRAAADAVTPRDILWTPPRRLEFVGADGPNPPARPDAQPDGGASEPAAGLAGEMYEPQLSWDGTALYFVRGKAGGGADIYTSRLTPRGWTQPEPLAAVNSEYDELGPSPSPDGDALYFYSDRPGGFGGYDVWVAWRGGGGGQGHAADASGAASGGEGESAWQSPVNLGPAVNSEFNDYGPAVGPGNDVLYFSSNRPLPDDRRQPDPQAWPATVREDFFRRTYDLYQSRLTAQGPAPAEPLTALNSSANEGAPCVSPAGDFLYFASDRSGGEGGFDLYRARRRGASAAASGTFDEPRSLGREINTPANELDPGLTHLGFALYFSSDRAPPEHLGERPASAGSAGGVRHGRYALYAAEAREVFRDTAVTYPPPIAWTQLWPWLLWLALLVLLAALILALVGSLRDKRLGLLARCLLASLLAHALLMLGLSFWRVTAGLAAAIRSGGPIEIALLPAGGGDELVAQVRGSFTDVSGPEAESPAPLRAEDLPRVEIAARPIETTAERVEAAVLARGSIAAEAVAREPAAAPAPPQVGPDAAPAEPDVPLAVPADSPRVAVGEAAAPAAEPDASAARSRPQAAPVEHAAAARVVEIAVATGATVSDPLAGPSAGDAARESSAPASLIEVERATAVRAADSSGGAIVALATPGEARRMRGDEPSTPAPAVAWSRVESVRAGVAPPGDVGATDAPRLRAVAAPRTDVALAADVEPAAAARARESAPPRDRPVENEMPATAAVRGASGEVGLALPGGARVTGTGPSARKVESGGDEPVLRLTPAAGTTSRAPAVLAGGGAGRPDVIATRPPAPRPPEAGFSLVRLEARNAGPTPLAGVASPDAAPAPSAGAGNDIALRLPAASPAANGDFSQRAPEQRLALVQKMGGSGETEGGVSRALAWLARHQSADGSWSGRGFDAGCGGCDGETTYQVDVALTGLSLLAFLGADHTHTRSGPYQEHVRRGLAWLAGRQRADGDLRAGETMYSHGIAAIALAEAAAMTGDAALKESVARAVGFIEQARNRDGGGWRYEPGQEGDTSILGWVVMAARSAQRAGVDVSPEVFEGALRWLERVASARRPGQYAYRPGEGPTPAMTAEGLFILELLGTPATDRRVAGAVAVIERNPPSWDEPNTYYWYYATLALFQQQGEAWRRWNARLVPELLAHQEQAGKRAGSWPADGEWARIGGRVYQTALCTLMLEVYYRYLPMYGVERPAEGVGVVTGRVTEAGSGEPLPGARVTFDRSGAPPLVALADAEGRYALSIPEVPDFFALSATHAGYVPASANVSALKVRGRTHALDFALAPGSGRVVAIESDPQVHHLGNDLFEGRINSQFQKSSEGRSLERVFELTADQLAGAGRPRLSLMARGVQCPHQVRVNGRLLAARLGESPADGSFGRVELEVAAGWLVGGANVVSIRAVACNGDLDDFEFVNLQLELAAD